MRRNKIKAFDKYKSILIRIRKKEMTREKREE